MIILGVWSIVLTVYLSIKMGQHLASYKLPAEILVPFDHLLKHQDEGYEGWSIFHVVFPECVCANSLISSLIKRKSISNIQEFIIIQGKNFSMEKRLQASGYRVISVPKITLRKVYNISAAPLFFISFKNTLLYAGGYYNRPSNYRSLDFQIIMDTMSGKTRKSLPLYGCGFFD
ncbi:MAG: hypothetical protein AB8C84_12840 [Oligoflexales bacterium]